MVQPNVSGREPDPPLHGGGPGPGPGFRVALIALETDGTVGWCSPSVADWLGADPRGQRLRDLLEDPAGGPVRLPPPVGEVVVAVPAAGGPLGRLVSLSAAEPSGGGSVILELTVPGGAGDAGGTGGTPAGSRGRPGETATRSPGVGPHGTPPRPGGASGASVGPPPSGRGSHPPPAAPAAPPRPASAAPPPGAVVPDWIVDLLAARVEDRPGRLADLLAALAPVLGADAAVVVELGEDAEPVTVCRWPERSALADLVGSATAGELIRLADRAAAGRGVVLGGWTVGAPPAPAGGPLVLFARSAPPPWGELAAVGHLGRLVAAVLDDARRIRGLRHRADRLETLLGVVGDGVAVIEEEAAWLSPVAARLLDLPPLAGLPVARIVDAVDPADRPALESLLAGGDGPVRVRARGGDRPHLAIGVRTPRVNGPMTVLVIRDVTAEVMAAEAARRAESRYRSVVERVREAVLELTADGRIGYASPAFLTLTGTPPGMARGRELVDFAVSADRAELRATIGRLRTSPEIRTEFRIRTNAGTVRWVELVARPVVDPDASADGTPPVVATLADVTERRRAEAELEHRALHDPLTGLPNRTLLVDRLAQALRRAERSGTRVAVLFCDLDRFKEINDSEGHEVGDRLLRSVAERFARVVRRSETIARYGGDEFVVVGEGVVDDADALRLAQRIHDAMATPFHLGGHPVVLGVSIGAAVSRPGADPATLIREADAAMYEAKRSGRGRTVVSTEAGTAHTNELERHLGALVGPGRLAVAFQPVVTAGERRPVAAEATLRWEPVGTGRGPDQPVAELLGNADQRRALRRWLLTAALDQLAAWDLLDDVDRQLAVIVALDADDLDDLGLCETVTEALEERRLAPGRLWLDVPADALASGPRRAVAERLHAGGVVLSVRGLEGLSAAVTDAAEAAADILRLAPDLVGRLPADRGARLTVSAIVGIAAEVGALVAGTGVRTEAQARALRDLGVDLLQGDLVGPPTPGSRLRPVATDGVVISLPD